MMGINFAWGGHFAGETGLKRVFGTVGTINSCLLKEWICGSRCSTTYTELTLVALGVLKNYQQGSSQTFPYLTQ